MDRRVLIGVACVFGYTLMISGADAITKRIAGQYEAPQFFALSAFLVIMMTLCCGVAGPGSRMVLQTGAPGAMLARSVLTVVATLGFFMAFRALPFADVFLFIGLMPILAGILSGPLLGETIRPQSWAALALGALGVFCLMPDGMSSAEPGHIWAAIAVISGTASMVLARRIARSGTGALAQVFYPNLAILVVMALALPQVWAPMAGADLGWTVAYAAALFGARWVVVEALMRLPAYVATPLMNLQFVWMLAMGMMFFGERPGPAMLTGAALVIGSGIWLVWLEHRPRRDLVPV